jgi:hypothetical protein
MSSDNEPTVSVSVTNSKAKATKTLTVLSEIMVPSEGTATQDRSIRNLEAIKNSFFVESPREGE